MSRSVRPAAVAGTFYTADPVMLDQELRDLLAAAAQPPPGLQPKALIVPHAGYLYSGGVAASAYASLRPVAARVERVVLLGPTHRIPVRGLAVPTATAFATPLGTVPVDDEALTAIADLAQVVTNNSAHAWEHSLEVQLPFLQQVLGSFRLVPLAVGDASAEEVAEVIERLWGGDETLIVVSSDLSHFHPHAEARRIDGATLRRIVSLDGGIRHEQACGATPVNGFLIAARRHGLAAHLLDACNSGDTAGDQLRVVGYAAIAFSGAHDGQ